MGCDGQDQKLGLKRALKSSMSAQAKRNVDLEKEGTRYSLDPHPMYSVALPIQAMLCVQAVICTRMYLGPIHSYTGDSCQTHE